MSKILVTTSPFGKTSERPKALLQSHDVVYNDMERKHTQDELCKILSSVNPDYIIAGTEKYDRNTLCSCKNLKMISRVGIGVDGIDFDCCKERGIVVSNTPDAPSNAVAELTILQMLNMLRKVQNVSTALSKQDKWNRYIGRELRSCVVGVVGMGRIGKLVVDKMSSLSRNKILINDIDPNTLYENIQVAPATIYKIFDECDIITIHIPLNDGKINNKGFICKHELGMMKPDVRLLNMSRGGIINEDDLYNWLKENKKACAAIDCFENEVYRGKLTKLGNAYLTPHLGSCTVDSRNAMETEASQNVIDHIMDREIKNRVV